MRFSGNVLIGGLGIGWATLYLDRHPKVKSVVVVERSKQVVKLVWKYLPLTKTRIVTADLYKFLRDTKKNGQKFDYAYYDIWGPTGETVLTEHVRPLRTLSEGVVAQENIECWEEATMLGQIRFHLDVDIRIWEQPEPFGRWKKLPEEQFLKIGRALTTQWPFLNWMRKTKPTQEEALEALDRYVKTYSNETEWRKTWGAYALGTKRKGGAR